MFFDYRLCCADCRPAHAYADACRFNRYAGTFSNFHPARADGWGADGDANAIPNARATIAPRFYGGKLDGISYQNLTVLLRADGFEFKL